MTAVRSATIATAGAGTCARRPAPADNGRQRAMIAKRTRCQLCGGKGRYRAASGATVSCKRIGEPGVSHR